MYSLEALPDTSGSHFGFYTLLVLCAVALFLFIRDHRSGNMDRKDFVGAVLLTVAFVTGGGFLSFLDKPPVNELVAASFVGYVPPMEKRPQGRLQPFEYLTAKFQTTQGEVLVRVPASVKLEAVDRIFKN